MIILQSLQIRKHLRGAFLPMTLVRNWSAILSPVPGSSASANSELIQWGTATKEGEPTFYQVSPTRPAAACSMHLYQPRVNQESCQSPLILGVIGMCLADPSIRSWSWKLLGKTNRCMWIPLRRNIVLYWQQNKSRKNKINNISSPLSSVLGEKLTGTGIISKVTPKRQVV